MKYRKFYSLLVAAVLTLLNIFAQTDTVRYLDSGFETSADRQKWTSVPPDENIKWTFQNGGHNLNPPAAYEGNYNALFYWADLNPNIRTLVSSPIDLSTSSKPQLTFRHAQYQSIWGIDELRLLFRVGATGNWDTIETYPSEYAFWDLETFNIHEIDTKYLVNNFYVGFMGISKGGHGVCIDEVIIEEKDEIIKYVYSTDAQNVIHDLVPSGLTDIPVFRIDIVIVGNTGQAILNSVSVKSLCPDNSIFETNGFELIATRDSIFKTKRKGVSTKIGTPASISNGVINFSSLNYTLNIGLNSIWLIADIKADADHKSVIKFMLEEDKVDVNGLKFPGSDITPPGQNTVEESIFSDNFETDKGWDLDYDFEIDVPQGFYAHISSDPPYAYSGNKVMGTDLTEDGKYLLNIDSTNAYFAVSPVLNCKYYDDVKLNFRKWVAFEGNDLGTIDIRFDNKDSWQTIWNSKIDALTPDYGWEELTMSSYIDKIASRQDTVQFRFAIKYSNFNYAYAGWNIDNFALTGNHLVNDIGIVRIIGPEDDCLNTGFDSVKVVIRNYAEGPTNDTIPLFFSKTGISGPRVYDTIFNTIAQDDSIVFTFSTPANFTSAGNYNKFIVVTDARGDEDPTNDSLTKPVFIQESLNTPSFTNFETNGGYWRKDPKNSTWMCKQPDGSIPVIPGSPKSWILAPYGNYIYNDSSYIISSCYDLADGDRKVFQLKYWLTSEIGKDGANVQYSYDDGETWHLLDTNEYGWDWGWYSEQVESLNNIGWSGTSAGWETVRQLLPSELNSEPKVKFRIYWASDSINNYRGIAIDNVEIFSAPPDIGVLSIDSHKDDCQYANPDKVTVTIKNFGLNKLTSNEDIIVGMDFESEQPVIEEFKLTKDLNPGDTIHHTFNQTIDIITPKIYTLKAYTLIEDDPWFYEINNDTSTLLFEVYQNPVANWVDTITTKEPDTVVVRPNVPPVPTYGYLWEDMSTADNLQINKPGLYYVTITDVGGNGCVTVDSILIELLFNDMGIDSLLSPVSSCELGPAEYLTVQIRNYGTDSIDKGEEVVVAYELNDGPPVTDTFNLDKTLFRGRAMPYTFTVGPVNMTAIGTYKFKLYADMGGDTIPDNDTIVTYVNVYGYPTVDLGPDTTLEALYYELDPGSGYSAYLWEDGDTNQVHIADTTGIYHIIVWDEHNCEAYDTVKVRLKILDIAPSRLISPVDNCDFDNSAEVQLEVRNVGNDTLASGKKIYVRYKLNNNPYKIDSIALSSELIPGSTVNHTFDGTENLSSTGDYKFIMVATTKYDLRSSNDTLYDTISVYPEPVVDFGLEPDPYEIEAKELILDAGYGPYYQYKWQDGHDEQTYTVTMTGIYRVTVTDTRTGCYGNDNITISLITPDISITDIDLTEDICSGIYDNVEIEITNLGNKAVGINDNIYVRYYLDADLTGYEPVPRSAIFNPGVKLYYQLNSAIDLSETGDKVFMIYSEFDQDLIPENDTVTLNMSIIQSPVVDFGDDNGYLQVTLPHDLNAGAGHKSYLWQDNSTNPVYTVTNPGIYTVTVTGNNDCQTVKTVRVNIGTFIHNFTGKYLDVNIYPNPANDIINIELNLQEFNDLKLEIINAQGQVIYNSKLNSDGFYEGIINISGYSKGIYYIKISNNELIHISKIIIF
jgi:hypothetical protein